MVTRPRLIKIAAGPPVATPPPSPGLLARAWGGLKNVASKGLAETGGELHDIGRSVLAGGNRVGQFIGKYPVHTGLAATATAMGIGHLARLGDGSGPAPAPAPGPMPGAPAPAGGVKADEGRLYSGNAFTTNAGDFESRAADIYQRVTGKPYAGKETGLEKLKAMANEVDAIEANKRWKTNPMGEAWNWTYDTAQKYPQYFWPTVIGAPLAGATAYHYLTRSKDEDEEDGYHRKHGSQRRVVRPVCLARVQVAR